MIRNIALLIDVQRSMFRFDGIIRMRSDFDPFLPMYARHTRLDEHCRKRKGIFMTFGEIFELNLPRYYINPSSYPFFY